MTVTGALAYAELAAMMPKAGGQYVFLREGLSPLAGFLYGWTLFAVIQTGTIAAVAVAFAKFLGVLVPGAQSRRVPAARPAPPARARPTRSSSASRPSGVVAILMIAVLTATNMRGVTLGAAIQTVFSVAKVGALAALVLLGLTIFRQPDIAAANFAELLGHGRLVAGGAPGASARPWWARCSRATRGTTSPSPPPRCRTRPGTCPARSRSAPAW